MLVVLAGCAALIGVAAPAYADPVGTSGPDASFLAALNQAGITYQDPDAAVGVGKRACQLMDEGSPQVEVIKSVSSSNPGFTVDGAAQFTMIAASAYCPQHLGQQATKAPTPTPASTPQPAPVIDLPPLTPGAA
ncbi:hypothetical protein A5683_19725 [Mycobacterium mantenii]|uniref:DUF732 domain-containing protein n=2 Tax=Mycobacterium mantenii TaxID=560555 RepID=A0A1A2TL79_MYCNT|nr:hypothetical protein A5688_24945 [Mycobacterium mantenii]OBH77094.1 hypothetical protein A5683_19725 [Mycobacterium mantenii]